MLKKLPLGVTDILNSMHITLPTEGWVQEDDGVFSWNSGQIIVVLYTNVSEGSTDIHLTGFRIEVCPPMTSKTTEDFLKPW